MADENRSFGSSATEAQNTPPRRGREKKAVCESGPRTLAELMARQEQQLSSLALPVGREAYGRRAEIVACGRAGLLHDSIAPAQEPSALRGLRDVADECAEAAAETWDVYHAAPLDTLSRIIEDRFCVVAAPVGGDGGGRLRALSGSLCKDADVQPLPLHCVLCGPVLALPSDVLADIIQDAARHVRKKSFALPLTEVTGAGDGQDLEIDCGWDIALRSGCVGHHHTGTRDMLAAKYAGDCGGVEDLRELARVTASRIGVEHCTQPPLDRQFVLGLLRDADKEQAKEMRRRVAGFRDARQPSSVLALLHLDTISVWLTPDDNERGKWREVVSIRLSDVCNESDCSGAEL
eukprot:TRINITY_DN12409_c0_g1_i2.p1 TRINITY_DN12409_c0_g1~~TRINITY_DN12409_c0_g1_i2.p1  ORF type:complete len:370 (+),score=61.35 TRINITY_DN12409_c0_g1_i2:64-1110(+)